MLTARFFCASKHATEELSIHAESAKKQPGPIPDSSSLSQDNQQQIRINLPKTLGSQGSIALWLRSPGPISNGSSYQGGEQTFFEMPGLVKCNLWWYSGYCQFNFQFADGPNHEIQLPGVPGPQWLHFCFCWDANKGILQAYMNGTPTRIEGTGLPSWSTVKGDIFVLTICSWAISDLRIYDYCVKAENAGQLVPPLYRGSMDHLLGTHTQGTFVNDGKTNVHVENSLRSQEAVCGWKMEGPGKVSFSDGWMEMHSLKPDDPGPEGHIVYWCNDIIPANFQAEFDCQMLSEHGLCITFFCAKGSDEEDIFDPALKERTGIFGHYTNGDINCYHCSWYANTPDAPGRGTSNLRKNPGFYLVDQGPVGIPPGSRDIHHVIIRKKNARIEVFVDNNCIIRWFDPGDIYGQILGEGKIGFRQMKWMKARYRNFKVFELI